MALIKCEECGKNVSDKATECPHCGYDLTAKEQTKEEVVESGKKINAGNVVLNVFLFVLVSIYTIYVICNVADSVESLNSWNSFDSDYETMLIIGYIYQISVLVTLWLTIFYSMFKKLGLKITTFILYGIAFLMGLIYLIGIADLFSYDIDNIFNLFCSMLILPSMFVLIGLKK